MYNSFQVVIGVFQIEDVDVDHTSRSHHVRVGLFVDQLSGDELTDRHNQSSLLLTDFLISSCSKAIVAALLHAMDMDI